MRLSLSLRGYRKSCTENYLSTFVTFYHIILYHITSLLPGIIYEIMYDCKFSMLVIIIVIGTICLCVCLCVCGSVTMITLGIACIDPH